ncbi:MAG: DUF1761 domain-containing protein [Candidatus Doudnabacteria bacterium]
MRRVDSTVIKALRKAFAGLDRTTVLASLGQPSAAVIAAFLFEHKDKCYNISKFINTKKMEFNYMAILVATVAQFIFGAIWYTPIFGKAWAKINSYDELSPEQQDQMKKGMAPLFVTQFVVTLILTTVYSMFRDNLPGSWNPYGIAFFLWLGFIVPAQIGSTIWSRNKEGMVIKKIMIMAGAGLGNILIIAAIFNWLS